MSSLSIVIPCYNEIDTIAALVRKVEDVKLDGIAREIIIVDDGSTDGTGEWLQQHAGHHQLIFNQENLGKGASLRKAFLKARGDIIIIQDADLEYDPEDYPALLKPILDGDAKVVYGSRILHKQNKRHSGLKFYLGGRFLSWFTNVLYGGKLTDQPTCYKVFDRELLNSIPLKSKGFEFCSEVTAKLLKRGEKIIEVPIRYYPRSVEEGKKIGWADGFEALRTLIRYRFSD